MTIEKWMISYLSLEWLSYHERENFLQFVNPKIYSTINKTNITKTNKESTRVSVTK